MNDEILKKIAGEHGTPVYVYDKAIIQERCRDFKNAFDKLPWKAGFRYAFKANTNQEILGIILEEGFGGDIVSIGELKAGIKTGYKPDQMIYTSNSKSPSELKTALDSGVIITHGNMNECQILDVIAGKENKVANIAFRVNPDVNPVTHPKIATGLSKSKFGLHFENGLAFKAYKNAVEMDFINPVGMHCHIGSQIHDTTAFEEACEKMLKFASKLENELEIKLEFIDFGGGLGVNYEGAPLLSPEEFANTYIEKLSEFQDLLSYKPIALFEPGRFLVAESGVLLTKVNSIKQTPSRNFVNVDCGFNTLVRPAMYDAYHPIRVVGRSKEEETYDIAGNLCESGDILGVDRKLPKIKVDDMIEIGFAGAYGYSMSSNYNSQPRPPEILVEDNRYKVIRKRETIDELI